MKNQDPYNLARFVQAQEGTFEQACTELRGGRKTGHWMWFIFPQIAGLGYSEMSRRYAIRSVDEARAYLEHPVLGPRLREVCRIVSGIEGKTAYQILGSPDDMKLRSSTTLFAHATEQNTEFVELLRKYYGEQWDEKTLELIATAHG